MIYKPEELLGDSAERVNVGEAVLEGTYQGLVDVTKYVVIGSIAGIAGYLILGPKGVKRFISKVR